MGDGLNNFSIALENTVATEEAYKSDVWVAYVSPTDPNKFIYNHAGNKIEMAMAILVKENLPLVMHMGIARNPFYILSGEKQSQRISTTLHAFAAKAVLLKYQMAKYMITSPLSSMANLFKHILQEGSYSEGLNKEGTWVTQDIIKADTGSRISIFEEKYFGFTLYDRNINDPSKEIVVAIDDNNKLTYGWLFKRLHRPDMWPYFAVKLTTLSDQFKNNLTVIQ